MPTPTREVPVLRTLQALRFVAALVVVVVHACFYVGDRSDSAVPSLAPLAGPAVWLFFTISGFIMTVVTDRRPAPDWAAFAAHRILRIAPLYWALTTVKVLTILTAGTLVVDGALGASRVVGSYLFLPTHDEAGAVHPLWGVGWTLTFEMAFYALVTLALARRVDPVRAVGPVLVAAAVASIWRPETGSPWWCYADPATLYFLAGMIVGRGLRHRAPWATSSALLALGLLTALLAQLTGTARPWAQGLVFLLVSALLAVAVAAEPRWGEKVPRALVTGGAASYALYLTHPLVAPLVPEAASRVLSGTPPWPALVAVAVIVSLAAAPVVHSRVELPVTRALRRRVDVLLARRGRPPRACRPLGGEAPTPAPS